MFVVAMSRVVMLGLLWSVFVLFCCHVEPFRDKQTQYYYVYSYLRPKVPAALGLLGST